jgi:rubrerythrin
VFTFRSWESYFENHRHQFEQVPWHEPGFILESEKFILQSSVPKLHLGENSDGKRLRYRAQQFPDSAYARAVEGLILEEQTHAWALGRFMEMHNIKPLKSHWTDSTFRNVRHLSGLETEISTLLCAEVFATVYYKALGNMTSSKILRKICDQILIDEEMHLVFQCALLRYYSNHRSEVLESLVRRAHRVIMESIAIVTWWGHREVFRAARYSFAKYWDEIFYHFEECEKRISGFKGIEPSNPCSSWQALNQ